jgi:dienelactone hydrolase
MSMTAGAVSPEFRMRGSFTLETRMPRILSLMALATTIAYSQELKTATTHPMQYYLSLPEGWTAEKAWPVVVAIESANRDFQANAAEFARARGGAPFIVVAPLVVTGGGSGFRDVPTYHYTSTVWKEIDRVGAFAFDEAGIAAVIGDVHRIYRGEERYFLTGWEAGGHTVWAMLFQHPERLRAAAPVTPNYLGRWMSEESFSSSNARAQLPVWVFQSTQLPSPYIGQQSAKALEIAKAHGFGNVSVVSVDKAHGPLAEDVLRFFEGLLH